MFAHLVGTLELLDADERALVRGLVINRFRGDPSLLAPAIEDLERRTGVPVLGVVWWINDLRIAEEDAVALERRERRASERGDAGRSVDIAVVRLLRIANFDDFDPLAREAGVTLRYVERAAELGTPDLIVLPRRDPRSGRAGDERARHLRRLPDAGRDDPRSGRAGDERARHLRRFQLLGETILDEHGVEAAAGTQVPGLGLPAQTTTFSRTKETQRSRGTVEEGAGAWASAVGLEVSGYQIHTGSTEWLSDVTGEPFLTLDGEPDGAMLADGRVAGTYLHGLFHNDAVRRALLRSLGWSEAAEASQSHRAQEAEFDRVAEIVRTHLDIPRVRAMVDLEAAPK